MKKIIRNILLILVVFTAIFFIAVEIAKYILGGKAVFIIRKNYYYAEELGLSTYKSLVDKDNDGIDDQTDILNNVFEYIATEPKYKSEYYQGGYNDGSEYGVCTDVVAYGLRNAGYDIMNLVDEDVKSHLEDYDIEKPDKNIDFRRVRNLYVYLKRNAISLTIDLEDVESWQGGDIVVFKTHIGVVSDKRNVKGVPYLIHHANPYQLYYEEDALEFYKNEIIGHFRIS